MLVWLSLITATLLAFVPLSRVDFSAVYFVLRPTFWTVHGRLLLFLPRIIYFIYLAIPTNDYVRLVLDTHHDLRSAYYFATNSLGAQVDAEITENGKFHMNWDAIWDCAATRHSQGWSAEFSIPFGQLRYPDKEKHIWGFNCARSIQRSDEWGIVLRNKESHHNIPVLVSS